jgi:membrane protease YdiL (CAAX protease family)
MDILEKAIINAKDKSVLSWWWLTIPLYIIAGFIMKTSYVPGTTLAMNLHELAGREKYFCLLFFLALPLFFIVINFISIRKIYILSGSPKNISILRSVWYNVLIIFASLSVLIIYSL